MKERNPEQFGHPRFYEILESLADLHSRKNHDYAAGGNALGNFNRVAAILAMYPDLELSDPAVIALIYSMKQLDAVLWSYSNKHNALVEEKADKLMDMAVYAVLVMVMEEEKVRYGERSYP